MQRAISKAEGLEMERPVAATRPPLSKEAVQATSAFVYYFVSV